MSSDWVTARGLAHARVIGSNGTTPVTILRPGSANGNSKNIRAFTSVRPRRRCPPRLRPARVRPRRPAADPRGLSCPWRARPRCRSLALNAARNHRRPEGAPAHSFSPRRRRVATSHTRASAGAQTTGRAATADFAVGECVQPNPALPTRSPRQPADNGGGRAAPRAFVHRGRLRIIHPRNADVRVNSAPASVRQPGSWRAPVGLDRGGRWGPRPRPPPVRR